MRPNRVKTTSNPRKERESKTKIQPHTLFFPSTIENGAALRTPTRAQGLEETPRTAYTRQSPPLTSGSWEDECRLTSDQPSAPPILYFYHKVTSLFSTLAFFGMSNEQGALTFNYAKRLDRIPIALTGTSHLGKYLFNCSFDKNRRLLRKTRQTGDILFYCK